MADLVEVLSTINNRVPANPTQKIAASDTNEALQILAEFADQGSVFNGSGILYKQAVDPSGSIRMSPIGQQGFPLTNVVSDGGFEEALKGWNNLEPNSTTYSLDEPNKLHGRYALKIQKTNANNNGLEKTYLLTPGKKYYLFTYAKSLSSISNYALLGYKAGTDPSVLANIYVPIVNTLGNSGTYKRIGGKFIADGLNNQITIRLCARSAVGTVFFDGLTLFEVDDSTYEAIGTTLTGAQLEAAIPVSNEDKILERIKSELLAYNSSPITGFIDAKRVGDIGRGLDDTPIFQEAINQAITQGVRAIHTPAGTYNVRELQVPDYFQFRGFGDKSLFRLTRSGDSAADANSVVIKSIGSHSVIENIKIDNGNWYGNALDIIPDAGGFQRRISQVTIMSFAGFNPTAVGGTYGIRGNYAKADISNDTGAHLLTGGNGITVKENSNSGWELNIDNIRISNMDGYGLNGGSCTDSKFTNVWIGGCVYYGFSLPKSNKNCQMSGLKVYRCNILNPAVNFATSLVKNIPHEATRSTDFGAVIITGANHQITNLECQENGSSGLQIGTAQYSCNNCSIVVCADGNGGYDADADAPTKENFRRYGIRMVNYNFILLSGVCDDFRAKFLLPRQAKGIYIAPRPEFSSTSEIKSDDWYRIKTLGTGTRFDLFQRGYAVQVNTVGHAFQLRNTYPATGWPVGATFGTGGKLEAVNDNLFANLIILNQYDVDQNIGLDYDLTNEGGNSMVTINGIRVIDRNEVVDDSATPYSKATLNAKYPKAKKGFKVLAYVAGFTYQKIDDSPTGNWLPSTTPLLT